MITGSLLAFTGLTSPSGAAPVTDVFTADGTFVVPAGVTCVTIQAAGGGGGTGGGVGGEFGGDGALVTATFPVTVGESLDIVIGQPGGDGEVSSVEQPTPAGGPGGAGYTSGGDAGDALSEFNNASGGGGGGSTAVLRGSAELVVAAGGGGGGASPQQNSSGGDGGDGGNPGEFGGPGFPVTADPAIGGGGLPSQGPDGNGVDSPDVGAVGDGSNLHSGGAGGAGFGSGGGPGEPGTNQFGSGGGAGGNSFVAASGFGVAHGTTGDPGFVSVSYDADANQCGALVTTTTIPSSGPVSLTFRSDASFTIPAGVSCINITAAGGRGGDGGGDGGAGGLAEQVLARVPVQPGEVLDLAIGQDGGDGRQVDIQNPVIAGGAGGAGHRTGGDGGDHTSVQGDGSFATGGGGGGATGVLRAGTELVVSAGAGGGGAIPTGHQEGSVAGEGGDAEADGTAAVFTSSEAPGGLAGQIGSGNGGDALDSPLGESLRNTGGGGGGGAEGGDAGSIAVDSAGALGGGGGGGGTHLVTPLAVLSMELPTQDSAFVVLQFDSSANACGSLPSTTTSTTTTAPASTSTSVAESTTTTLPGSTTTSPTDPGSVGGDDASQGPTALPRTGGGTDGARTAFGLLLVGVGLVVGSRAILGLR